MAAFATPEDLATAQRRDLDAADTATATYLLEVATQLIQDYCEQTIEAQDGLVETLRHNNGVWMVKEIPIRAIDSVTVDGDAFDGYDVDLSAGILTRNAIGYYSCDDAVVITYDSGYETIPNSVRGVCVDVAKRAFENPAGIQRDDLNTASQWLGLTEENEKVLNRYKV